MTARRKVPQWVWVLVKIGIAACIIAWMLRQDVLHLEQDDMRAALARWYWLAIALGVLLGGMFLQSVRWGILLRAQGIDAGTLELFTLAMMGLFFTLVAPGGIGGDAVKAFYVARGRSKKAEAATTVFFDRFLGAATLFFVAAVAVGITGPVLWNTHVQGLDRFGMPGGRVLVLAVAAGVVVVVAFALLVTSKRIRRSAWLGTLARFVPFRSTAARVYDAMHLYGDRPGTLLLAGVVSVAAQSSLFVAYYLYGLAVGAGMAWWHCLLIVPPAMVVRVLPLVPGGAGQGMVAMALLFPLVGVSKAAGGAVGMIGDAMFVLVYLIGGLFFVFGRATYREQNVPPAETRPES